MHPSLGAQDLAGGHWNIGKKTTSLFLVFGSQKNNKKRKMLSAFNSHKPSANGCDLICNQKTRCSQPLGCVFFSVFHPVSLQQGGMEVSRPIHRICQLWMCVYLFAYAHVCKIYIKFLKSEYYSIFVSVAISFCPTL